MKAGAWVSRAKFLVPKENSFSEKVMGSFEEIFARFGLLAGSPQKMRLEDLISVVGEFGITDGADFAAELLPPMFHRVSHFLADPVVEFVTAGGACWEDENEAVHEGVIDRALEAGFLSQRSRFARIDDRPLAIFLAEVSAPGMVGEALVWQRVFGHR